MKKNILGSWMLWEPDAYDKKDSTFINSLGHDETGRVNSFWHWLNDEIVHENNIDWQTSGWYQTPKKRLKETLEDPYFYTVSGKEMLLISSIQPIVHDGKFHGVIGVDLKLEIIQKLVASLKIAESGYSSLIANNGMYIAHPDTTRIGKKAGILEIQQPPVMKIDSSKKAIFETVFDDTLNLLTYRLPITVDIGNVDSPWTLIITIPVNEILKPAIDIRNEIFFTGLVSGLIMLLLLTLLVRNLLTPILDMTALLKTKFNTEHAILPQFNIKTHDEIGELASSFNEMSVEVNHSRQQLEELNNELSAFNEQLEQRVIQKTQKLLESEKMASLGRLVAGISHELNTPVGVCVTALSFLQDQLALDSNSTKEQISESLNLLSENINKISALINSLKLLSIKSSSEKKTPFNYYELLETTTTNIQSQFDASGIDIIIEGENIEINSYPNALSQVLSHIISNSITHAFKSQQGNKAVIKISLQTLDNMVKITCEDNGIGMDSDMTDKIFEAFATKRLGTAGKGLGMNIVYNIVTIILKGSIECESQPGKGTRYHIQFFN